MEEIVFYLAIVNILLLVFFICILNKINRLNNEIKLIKNDLKEIRTVIYK